MRNVQGRNMTPSYHHTSDTNNNDYTEIDSYTPHDRHSRAMTSTCGTSPSPFSASTQTSTARRKLDSSANADDGDSDGTTSPSPSASTSRPKSRAIPHNDDTTPTTTPSTLLYQIQIASVDIPPAYITPFCGAAAGAASGIVTCPLDVIKTKLQAQGGFQNGNGSAHHPHPNLGHHPKGHTRAGGGGGGGGASGPTRTMAATSDRLFKVLSHGTEGSKGMIGTGKMILRDEGVRGFYRGLAPMLLGYLPTWAVYMTVYDISRHIFESDGGSATWWLSRMGASVTAGACSTIATNPIWVIKTRLMSQSLRTASAAATTSTSDGSFAARPSNYSGPSWGYRGTIDAFCKIYKSEGLRTFYSGLTPALLGLSHVAIQFPLYEFFKMQFTGYEIGEAPPPDHHHHHHHHHHNHHHNSGGGEKKDGHGHDHDHDGWLSANKHWIGISAATFLSKICASTITYPHEVLRTRLQTQQRYLPPGRFGEHGVSVSDPRYEFSGGGGGGGNDTSSTSRRGKSKRKAQPNMTTTAAASSDGMPNRPRYHGILQSCKTILREEGWRAFYAGIGTNLFRAVPSAMTTMLTYEYLKGVIGWMQREGEERLGEMDRLDA